MDIRMVNLICAVLLIAAGVAFILTLAEKWGWREWLMVHAPNEFLYRLFLCKFCCSWWMLVIVTLCVFIIVRDASLLAVPVFATPIVVRLW